MSVKSNCNCMFLLSSSFYLLSITLGFVLQSENTGKHFFKKSDALNPISILSKLNFELYPSQVLTFFAHKWDSKTKYLCCTNHCRKIGLISFEMKARKARRAFEPSVPIID